LDWIFETNKELTKSNSNKTKNAKHKSTKHLSTPLNSIHKEKNCFIMAISSRFYQWFAMALLLLSEMSLSGAAPSTDVACSYGYAGEYPCSKVDLIAHMPLDRLKNSIVGNDVWGWTKGSREFAIYGLYEGHVFIEITNGDPVIKGYLPGTDRIASIFRDVKVIGDYAYMGSLTGHGIQIFDLNTLLDIDVWDQVTNFEPNVTYFGTNDNPLSNSQNIVANEESNYIYVVGSNDCDGGLHVVDVSNPLDPQFAGCFSDDGITLDAQCVNYKGPDSNYVGSEICFCFNDDVVTIVDVTDKSNMTQLSRTGYSNDALTNQGWLSSDQSYVVFGDYWDEGKKYVEKTRTMVFNIKDLKNPTFAGFHYGQKSVVDSNQYITSGTLGGEEIDLIYQANSEGGMTILQVIDYEEAEFVEVGTFDTYPASDNPLVSGWNVAFGAFSVYPFFSSGLVLISTYQDGLFVVKPNLEGSETVCSDVTDFLANGKEGRNCDWIAKKPQTRCLLDSETFSNCPSICHPKCTGNCQIDSEYRQDDNDKRSCDWVAKNSEKRCHTRDGSLFIECSGVCNPVCTMDCTDDTDYELPGGNNGKTRNCEWIAKKKETRCELNDGEPYEHCPGTCNDICALNLL
jgi:choice-of-anchor B domain-containing protein